MYAYTRFRQNIFKKYTPNNVAAHLQSEYQGLDSMDFFYEENPSLNRDVVVSLQLLPHHQWEAVGNTAMEKVRHNTFIQMKKTSRQSQSEQLQSHAVFWIQNSDKYKLHSRL